MVTRGASSLLLSGGGAMTVARTFEEYEDLVRGCVRGVRVCWRDARAGNVAADAAVGACACESELEGLQDAVQLVSDAGCVGAELGG